MKINWLVRFRNPVWVGAFISQVFIVVQIILVGLNGIGVTDFQLTKEVEGWILTLVNAIFVVLASLGVVQDPTVKGVSDSNQALRYDEPKNNTKSY
ncbi:MAG: phage holin [Phocaeicola sp.]